MTRLRLNVEQESESYSNCSYLQVCHTCQDDFDYIIDPEDMMPSDSMEYEYIAQYIRPQRQRGRSSLQARKGEIRTESVQPYPLDTSPMGLSTPPSQWLQSGKVRTYQDIIHGRLKDREENEKEALPWGKVNDALRRRGQQGRMKDRFSMPEGEDTWSGSSDWVENRLGAPQWNSATRDSHSSGSSIPDLRDLFPSLAYSSLDYEEY